MKGYYPGAIISDYYVTVTKVETTETIVKVRAASQPEAMRIGKRFAQRTQTTWGPVVDRNLTPRMESQLTSKAEFLVNQAIDNNQEVK